MRVIYGRNLVTNRQCRLFFPGYYGRTTHSLKKIKGLCAWASTYRPTREPFLCKIGVWPNLIFNFFFNRNSFPFLFLCRMQI
jgi:hypothetical protein